MNSITKVTITWVRGCPEVSVAGYPLALREVRFLPAGLRRKIRRGLRELGGQRWVEPTLRE